MKFKELILGDAITYGSATRGEHHQGDAPRFCWVGDELRSDAWGAACEYVQPAVAKFNWRDGGQLEHSMDALRAIQQHYFALYFTLPVQCPGSQQRFTRAGGRIINRQGEVKIYDEGAETINLGGMTSECDKVEQLAGMVDHLFYAHGWLREEVAKVVKWYEETRSAAVFVQSFAHHSAVQDKYVKTLIKSAR